MIILFVVCVIQTTIVKAHGFDRRCTQLGHSHSAYHEPLGVMCDLCGCSTSSGSFGFGTLSNANFIGLRYIYQNFESRDGIFINSPVSKETFNTIQLWAQIPLNEKFYLTANLPYQDLSRKANNITESLNGMGDSSVMGWYKLPFYKKQKEAVTYTLKQDLSGHALRFGIGVKLSTGEFEESLIDNINPGFQVGTGSIDGVFSLGYNYGTNKFGVNTLASYYLKGENRNEYQFGNQFSYSVNVFTVFPKTKYNIMPFIGASGDIYNQIKQYGETLRDTDGTILNGTIGSEMAIEKFVFGINYTLPISQKLFGGNVDSKNRFSLYVNLAL